MINYHTTIVGIKRENKGTKAKKFTTQIVIIEIEMYNMIFEINGWISFEFNRRYITRFLYSYLFLLLSYSQWRISLYNYQKHLPIHNLEAMILDLNWTGSYIICFQTWKLWLLNLFDALTIPWVFPQQQWTWTACSQAIYMFFLTIFGILQTELFPRKCSQVGVPDVEKHITVGVDHPKFI